MRLDMVLLAVLGSFVVKVLSVVYTQVAVITSVL